MTSRRFLVLAWLMAVIPAWPALGQSAIRQFQQPNSDVPVPVRARPSWKAEGNQPFAQFGQSVSTAGDVNGDGYDDVIVGALFYDNGEEVEGGALVYYGSASGLSKTAGWTAEGNEEGANFGVSVSTAGDVNGDGYDDVIVGADYNYPDGGANGGRAFVYYGSASGLSLIPDWTAESDQENASFGGSVKTAGDVNGDGYDDVIIGAVSYDNGPESEGRVFVYYGSPSGLSLTPDWTAESDQVDAGFGISVGTAGDVNGDGYDDVVIGSYRYDNDQFDEGRVFVYHGSASGLSTTADWTAESDKLGSHFGYSVGTAGDVNGDGYDDVIVGAYDYFDDQDGQGRAFVYQGSAEGLSTTADWTAQGHQESAYFARSVGTTGDVNGDGYDDVLVGADYYTNGQKNEGRVFVYHGSASGLSAAADWTAESDQFAAGFGTSVGTAGDVNGDGYDDVIVGADYYDHGQQNEGAAVVFDGRPTAAVRR